MVIFLSALATTVAILTWLPTPFLWIALLWAAVLSVQAARTRRTSLRMLWINLTAVVITLGVVELYFHSRETDRMEGNATQMNEAHQVLGYAPVPERKYTSIKYHGDELVYDVRYTIDRRGLRVSPPARQPPPCGGVLFFGGSRTFGEGIEDDQTMPYQTGIKTGGHYSIYNFGYSGYGPHQMLAALERGVVDQVVHEPVSHVIYQGITDHVARAAGLATWDSHGPKYVLNRSDRPVYEGHFDDRKPRTLRWLHEQLFESSAFYRWLCGLRRKLPTQDQFALYTAIVAAARDAVVRKFPGAEFHVILWGYPGEQTYEAMRTRLRLANLNVHPGNAILHDYRRHRAAYQISRFDPHPNPRANELVAAYVSTRILHGSACSYAGLPVSTEAR